MMSIIENISSIIQNHEWLIWYLTIFSAIGFILSLAVIPVIIIKLPKDYFVRHDRELLSSIGPHPVLKIILLVVKNILGCVVFLMGVVMLVTPGQGLLFILLGVVLLDFPGKRSVQRWILSHKPIVRSVIWLRDRGNVEPLEFEE